MNNLWYLLCNVLHVVSNKIVALWMEKDWEAPGVFEGDEVGFARVEIKVHDLERADLLLSHL